MRIASPPSPPSFSALPQSPSPAPAHELRRTTRTRRSLASNVINLETQRIAQTLVRQADADLCAKFAVALRDAVNADKAGQQKPAAFGTVSDIPPNSTFGQLWAQLTHALNSEPFATFAKEKNIDISGIEVTPGGFLDCMIKGERTTFSKYTPGFEQAAAQVLATAGQLGPDRRKKIVYVGEHSARINEIGNFYGVKVPSSPARAEADIRLLQALKTFPSVLSPDGTAAQPSRQEYQHARQLQDEAEQDLALQIVREPGKFSPQPDQAGIAALTPPNPAQPTATPIQTQAISIDPLAAIAQRQFAGEPNIYSVVANALNDRIRQAAPGLDFNVNQIAIETPDPDTPWRIKRTQLMAIAFDHLSGGDAPNFTDADRAFDTRPDVLTRTGNAADTPLNLNVSALSGVIGALPDRLNHAYESEVREYWEKPAFSTATGADAVFSASHRTLVSRILKSNLQLAGLKQPGLDDDQRKTIDMVVRHPEGATRPAPLDPHSSAATVYTLSGSTPNRVIHRYLAQTNRDILLLVEPSGKITPFNSWDELESLGGPKDKVTGNLFDGQADLVIERHQGSSLTSPAFPRGPDSSAHEQPTLPDWMSNAGEAERFVMHELSLGLASFSQLNKGRSYNSDVKDIHSFAQQQFDSLPESRKLTAHAAKHLEVVFKVPYGTLGSGFIDRQTMSLTDMLLNNLSGLPDGQIEVFFKSGFKDENGTDITVRVPSLEKDGVLKQLINDLDIGKTYPDLLKKKLLDDPAEKARRQSLFVQQVPLELQFKALELSIKAESGFNPTGFRYVQELFKPGPGPRIVDGKEIVIRPLAFDNQANGKTDVVEGAYLIEPRDSTHGPHILYRPLMGDASLMQFPTRQALLAAIQNKGKLQNDILAWLPDEQTRNTYSGNGFKHPNLVIFGVNLGSVSLNKTIPLAVDTRLQQTLQAGTLMEHLYEANARHLITLAEQQSTSDAQSRWASLKEGGLLLLNSVLPVLRGPGAILGLIMQSQGIINDLGVLLDDDARNKEPALTDLLVNLATLFLQFKARSSSQPSTVTSNRPATDTSVLVDEPVPRTAPARNRIVLGGPADIKPLAGDIQVFVDEYNTTSRLNIMGHSERPVDGEPAHIVGEDGKRYTAFDIERELTARGINIRDYSEIRLLACYSASGGKNSLAAKLNALTGARVKGFEQEIIAEYSGTDDKNPIEIYQAALTRLRKRFPSVSDQDTDILATKELNKKLDERDINFNLDKLTGTDVELNIGSHEKPILYKTKVDYKPRTYGAPKIKKNVPKPVEVSMGYSHTVEDPQSNLSTRSLTDCSALAVLTDLKDGVYQKRTLMHLTGSNLEFGLFDQDAYKVLAELDRSLANGGKVIFVGGIDSQSPVGMGVVLGQEFQGKKPLLDILKKPGVETVIASSLGVNIQPDGTYKLIEGTGKGTFSKSMINDAFDFAD